VPERFSHHGALHDSAYPIAASPMKILNNIMLVAKSISSPARRRDEEDQVDRRSQTRIEPTSGGFEPTFSSH
jgi:hypothetical protein